ncbi:hypothetical protein BS50DRAFT_625763 [Corynespora cassiicola Philippines]|uniref:PA14 domain-containing protein n=1 Tax=Corynespora cassiicola Philippines TaxID=1448308 RepID=A0A2T2N5L6_CORCC|nr:hypothetical protein BS50DRAFT_625763 [Corynespora cassiicola Philippines]
MRFSSSVSLLLPAAVSASPVVDRKLLDTLFCKVNNIVITALAKDAAATTYCSSYLSIPTSTISTTVTETPSSVYSTIPVTVTGPAATTTETQTYSTTIDVTATITEVQTEYTTTTLTSSTSTITCLNSAYTYTPPVGVVPAPAAQEPEKRGIPVKKPTYLPKNWNSVYVSSACSCLAIPTPSTTKTATQTLAPGTITVYTTDVLTPTSTVTEVTISTSTNTLTETTTSTSTSTITAFATATTIRSNGVDYRKYTHPYDANLANSGFTSTFFKSLTPDFSGVLTRLTFATPNWPNGNTRLQLDDQGSSFDAEQSAILIQGFFIARETGTYTFESSAEVVDNWAYLWVGDAAYEGWDDGNAAFRSSRTGAPFFMNAGDAVPVSYLWANGGGVSQSLLRLYTPWGEVFEDHDGFFIRACSAEVFP